jgi:thymidylate synthase (FAD)
MRILQREGRFEILTPVAELRRQIEQIERAGRTCYKSYEGREIDAASGWDFLAKIIASGHLSVVEHSCLTVRFWQVSRACVDELVRHRHESPSVRSSRYVDAGDEFSVVAPPKRDVDALVEVDLSEMASDEEFDGHVNMSFREMAFCEHAYYRGLRKAGWKREDARQILPLGMATEAVVTANWREWRHIFNLRLNKRAHWEIRGVLGDLLLKLQDAVPGPFDDYRECGACEMGIPCYEGKYRERD